jgi:hypothetical protein
VPTLLDPLEREQTLLAHFKGINIFNVSLASPENGNRSSCRNMCFNTFRIPDDRQNPETQ